MRLGGQPAGPEMWEAEAFQQLLEGGQRIVTVWGDYRAVQYSAANLSRKGPVRALLGDSVNESIIRTIYLIQEEGKATFFVFPWFLSEDTLRGPAQGSPSCLRNCASTVAQKAETPHFSRQDARFPKGMVRRCLVVCTARSSAAFPGPWFRGWRVSFAPGSHHHSLSTYPVTKLNNL